MKSEKQVILGQKAVQNLQKQHQAQRTRKNHKGLGGNYGKKHCYSWT